MSNILEEILSTKTRRVKSDDDFYKRCFVKKSESYKRQVVCSINNFESWLITDNTTVEELIKYLKSVEEEHREETLVDTYRLETCISQ